MGTVCTSNSFVHMVRIFGVIKLHCFPQGLWIGHGFTFDFTPSPNTKKYNLSLLAWGIGITKISQPSFSLPIVWMYKSLGSLRNALSKCVTDHSHDQLVSFWLRRRLFNLSYPVWSSKTSCVNSPSEALPYCCLSTMYDYTKPVLGPKLQR